MLIKTTRAGVAQLVEQRTCNAKVEGSTPFTGTSQLFILETLVTVEPSVLVGYSPSVKLCKLLQVFSLARCYFYST